MHGCVDGWTDGGREGEKNVRTDLPRKMYREKREIKTDRLREGLWFFYVKNCIHDYQLIS